MIESVLAVVTMSLPILTIAGMLAAAEWRDRRRTGALARQIRLTDAIAGELGAVVAPVVSHPVGGPWRVEMRIPIGRPATAARVLAITHETLARLGAAPYQLVLTPEAPPPPPAAPQAFRPARALRVA
jgi:hypothetical protein